MDNKIILLIILIVVTIIVVGISIKKGLFTTEGFDEDIEDPENIDVEDTYNTEDNGIISTIVDKVSEVASSVSETVSSAVNSVSEVVSNTVDTITQTASDVKDSVVGTSNMPTADSQITIDDLTGTNTSTVSEIINSDDDTVGTFGKLIGLDSTNKNSDDVVGLSDEMTKDIGRKYRKFANSTSNYVDPLLASDFEYKEKTNTRDLVKKLKDISEMTKITEDIQGYYDNPGYYYLQ